MFLIGPRVPGFGGSGVRGLGGLSGMMPGIGGECVRLHHAKMNEGESTAVEGSVGAGLCASCSHASPKMCWGGILGHDARAFQLRRAAVG